MYHLNKKYKKMLPKAKLKLFVIKSSNYNTCLSVLIFNACCFGGVSLPK